MPKYSFEQMKTLPEKVFDNYYSADVTNAYSRDVYPLLTEAQADTLRDLIQDVYFLNLTPPDFLTALENLINDDQKFTPIAVKILSTDFLPIADHLDADILGLISDVGGNPNLFRSKIPARDAVEQVVLKSQLALPDERLLARAWKILESRILNARTDDQTIQMLTGPAKTSGVGLDEGKARELVMLANEERIALSKLGVAVMSDDDFDREEEMEEAAAEAGPAGEEAETEEAVSDGSEPAGEEAVPGEGVEVPEQTEEEVAAAVDEILATPTDVEPPAKPAETMQTVQTEDIQEIKRIEQAAAPQAQQAAQAEVGLLDRSVEEGIDLVGLKFDNDDIKRRFRNLVNLYFRDLRDSLETKSKMTMAAASGGMGLSDAEAERVMNVLEGKAKEYHQLLNDRTMQEKKQFVAQRAEQVIKDEEDAARREKENLDKMFTRLTGKSGGEVKIISQTVTAAPTAPPEPPEPPKPRFIPVMAVSSKPPAGAPAPAVPAATAPPPPGLPGASVAPAMSLPPRAPAAVPDKPMPVPPAPVKPPVTTAVAPVAVPAVPAAAKQAVVPTIPASAPPKPSSAPTPAVPAAKPAQVMPPAASGSDAKVVMADVKFVPKLTGPVDELRSLTVKDFRRLSRDPHEATLKIRDKIDLLEEQSFEVKTAGIKAWQDSEVNRLYLEMLRRSLEGRPILDIITEKEAKNEPVLAKAEFDAVMELNRKLRFG